MAWSSHQWQEFCYLCKIFGILQARSIKTLDLIIHLRAKALPWEVVALCRVDWWRLPLALDHRQASSKNWRPFSSPQHVRRQLLMLSLRYNVEGLLYWLTTFHLDSGGSWMVLVNFHNLSSLNYRISQLMSPITPISRMSLLLKEGHGVSP